MTTEDTGRKAYIITHSLVRRTLLAAAISTLGIGAARPENAWAQASPAPLIDVQVIDRDSGQAVRVWRHAGKLYVAGKPGARYGLRVTNNSGGRVLAVMSVDGINILSGETAGYDQGGYVFGPHESGDINGWRKSADEIAAFTFAPLADSYAAATGRPGNVGVIGVAAFRERVVARAPRKPPRFPPPPPVQPRPPVAPPADIMPPPPLPIPPVERRVETPAPPVITAAPPAPSQAEASAASLSAKLGTGHGEREFDHSDTVDFEPASEYPQYIYRVEYDTEARLIASGVIPRALASPPAPTPFPANRNGYVPDPPNGRQN